MNDDSYAYTSNNGNSEEIETTNISDTYHNNANTNNDKPNKIESKAKIGIINQSNNAQNDYEDKLIQPNLGEQTNLNSMFVSCDCNVYKNSRPSRVNQRIKSLSKQEKETKDPLQVREKPKNENN